MPDDSPPSFTFCDVSLPIPLDQPFTYELPLTLRHRVVEGSRVLAPFGARKLTGIVIRTHGEPPEIPAKPVLKLLDEEPVLGPRMLALGRWIADYYCAPLGEVLRSMAPAMGAVSRAKVYSLTDSGRDATKQLQLLSTSGDTADEVLRALLARPLTEAYLARNNPAVKRTLKKLEKKGWIKAEERHNVKDPLRAPSEKLRIALAGAAREGKFKKPERELLAFLDLHPGSHNLKDVEALVEGASVAARALGRREALKLTYEPLVMPVYPSRPRHALNEAQSAALREIREAILTGTFRPFLLHGITGSGKTEVYLQAIEEVLAAGRGALMLVPEIALTPAVAGQFYQRFGEKVAILHSAFTDSERGEQWRRIRSGDAPVVVGTRSGVFAPVKDVGLIVVDEEHDGSYKQGENPRYHARDVAVVRAQYESAAILLGSATPSLETRYNVQKGKYTLLTLPGRIGQRPLPLVELIDMREEFLETRKQSLFSRRLLNALEHRLENGEQAMLLMNRRGFSSFVTCRACGLRIECVNCAVTLTYHRRDRRLLCHYCDHAERVPECCPKCESEHVFFMGAGSEKVEDALHQHFPTARIARLDRDTVGGKRQYESILQGFREGSFDVLVGTQMIAKGHDIPNVTLVGVVSADIGLGVQDFRAAERTFQLLTQVAGRAGRGHLPGIVLVQTLNPEHYAIEMASKHDYSRFYGRELQFRQALRYPPFSALANILVRHEQKEEALRMSAQIEMLLHRLPEGLKALGPAEAPVPRLLNEYRYQVLLKAASRKNLRETLQAIRRFAEGQKWKATALVIDVDPISLM